MCTNNFLNGLNNENYKFYIMEEEKLLRKKKKAINGSSKIILAEACNALATFYYKSNRFDDALDQYKEEASIYKELGRRMEWGTCNRMIAEMYMSLNNYEKALKFEEKHLVVAKELNDLVEEQRAMVTVGRIYLAQGENTDTSDNKASFKAAEKSFVKALKLCEQLESVFKDKRELKDMRARLMLNMGLVQEQLGSILKAFNFLDEAISICSNEDLYDILFICFQNQTSMYLSIKDHAKALSCLNKALEVADRLENKVFKKCEVLVLKSDILCKMNDYHSAKQILLKAWKLKPSDEEIAEKVETNLKIVAAMCYTDDLVISNDPSDHLTFKKLYEKLGDGACRLQNYDYAIENYLKCLEHAQMAGQTGKDLVPIYVSLYVTYKDMGNYVEALKYCEKEYEIIKDVPKEAYRTLVNIIDIYSLAKKPYDYIEKSCQEAREAAKNCHNKKYEINVLKMLLKCQEEYLEIDKCDDTRSALNALGVYDLDNLEISEDEQFTQSDEDAVNIGDDICLDDLTDLSNDEEEAKVSEVKRVSRKRGVTYKVRLNLKGESQLHTACISGNTLLVERLLAKGHPVNVRDNAGWTPLHEACIHGHLDVVNVLVNSGAFINDRGGSNCDGITPLHDAASNGHLNVVKLLLDKGAIPSLKTDSNETALQILQRWRTNTVLNKDEEVLYKQLTARMLNSDNSFKDKNNFIRAKSKTPVKAKTKTSPPSTSKIFKETLVRSPLPRGRNIICDASDEDDCVNEICKRNQIAFGSDSESNDSIECNKTKNKAKNSVKEYRSAISALRNKNVWDDLPEVELKAPKNALLDPNEVDDDWLDDDLGINNKKRKRNEDPLTIVSTKRPSYDKNPNSFKKVLEDINNYNDSSLESISKSIAEKTSIKNFNSIIDIEENVSDNESKDGSIRSNTSMNRSRDSRENMRKRCRKQSTLFKSGFRRKMGSDNSSNSGSDSEIFMRKHSSPVSLTRKSSNDSLMSISALNDSFNIVHNSNILKPVNVIQPISILQSNNIHKTMTQILPPTAVKVRIEDKVFLISLKLETINNLSISWLVEEVKSRYYKLIGVRPMFNLMTSDGALLSEDDPLSLVLSSPELTCSVTTFKASPAEDRYLECCDALGIEPSEEIQIAIGRSQKSNRLSIGHQILDVSQHKPLFRAMSHQYLTAIMMPNNNLNDDCIKHLTECLITVKQINQLDLSFNKITSEGIKSFVELFEKSNRPICQSLDDIDISSNPIGDVGFLEICKLGQYLQMKSLRLNNCRITSNAFNENNKPTMNFDSLEVLDVGNNNLGKGILSSIINSLNPNLILDLELESVGIEAAEIMVVSKFLDSAKQLKLRRFNLSNCKLVDASFMKIFRSLSRANNLQTLTLKQNNLTFIALKKLLQRQPPIPQINLEGCDNIFRFSPDSDFEVWLPAVEFGRTVPEINATPVSNSSQERDSLKRFEKTWLKCFKCQGVIERGDGGLVRFTAK